MEIVIDDREHAIINLLDNSDSEIDIKVERIETGDYCILFDGEVVACLERKTWNDLARSIKDGRKNNMDKMIDLRDKTGCKLFYLIEGSPKHAMTRKFDKIEFKSLMGHLDRCQMLKDIHIIYAESTAEVLNRVIFLGKNYSAGLPRKVGGKDQRAFLKEKKPKTDEDIINDIWCSIAGISSKTADLLISNDVTVKKLYTGEFSISELAELEYDSGAKIGDKKAKNIIKSMTEKPTNILSAFNGVSKAMAVRILEEVPFEDIMHGKDVDKIKDIIHGKKRIGDKRAGCIIKFLCT